MLFFFNQLKEVKDTVIMTKGSRIDILDNDFKKNNSKSLEIINGRNYKDPSDSVEGLKFKKLYKNIPHSSIHSSTLLVFSKRIGLIIEATVLIAIIIFCLV